MIVHATLIARFRQGRWRGVLVRGPSGSGKSDLALRGLDAGWRLVADDRVQLWRSGVALYGRAPPPLAGLIEARGVGILPEPALAFAPVVLMVDACEAPERLPPATLLPLLGLAIPALSAPLRETSLLPKLERALCAALRGRL
jgi:serine kinase of HPr protein (carbohydrate metabolism regulator)